MATHRLRLAIVIGALALGGGAMASAAPAHAAPGVQAQVRGHHRGAAPALPPQITICLTNSSNFCADVKNSNDVAGQPVWLYNKNDGANDYHWYEWTTPCGEFWCLCPWSTCIEFRDAQNTNLCLAADDSIQGSAQLINCQLSTGGTARAAFMLYGNDLRNLFWAAAYLEVISPLRDKNTIYVNPSGGSDYWRKWSGPY